MTLDEPFMVDAVVHNNTGETVYVGGFIDLNGDGVFTADEYAQTEVPFDENALSQVVELNFNGPTVPGELFGRFRVSTDEASVQSPDGTAPNGEVEDYRFFAGEPTAVSFTQLTATTSTITLILSFSVALAGVALFMTRREA